MQVKIVEKIFVIILLLGNFSCIDRDTIAGTGKEDADNMIGAGGNFQTGLIRGKLPIPLRVRILAANGRPVRGIVVEYSNPQGAVSFSDTSAVTDGDGYASSEVTFGTVADSIKVYATVFGLKGSPIVFSLLSRAASEARAEKFSGDAQSGIVSGPLTSPLKVKVFDPYNNPVKNVTVIFSTSNGTFNNSVVKTDTNGVASDIWTLDSISGTKTAIASFPTLPGTTLQFTATGNAGTPTRMYAASNDSIHSLSGIPVPGGINVKMEDKYGNPTPGRQVQFSVSSGSPLILSSNVSTASTGIATAFVTLSFADSIAKVQAIAPQYFFPPVVFTFIQYIYLQIDSIRSSNGTVEIVWEKNLNNNFLNYSVERCQSSSFDQSTVIVGTITDENTISMIDNTAIVGTSPYYRIKVNYSTNFYFYSNIRQITVNP